MWKYQDTLEDIFNEYDSGDGIYAPPNKDYIKNRFIRSVVDSGATTVTLCGVSGIS